MSGRAGGWLTVLGLCLVLVACGGRAQLNANGAIAAPATGGGGAAPAVATASSGSGGAGTMLGGAASSSFAGGGGTPSTVLLGCPDTAPASQAICPELNVDLIPISAEPTRDSAVWVEPLQVPDFGTRPAGYFLTGDHSDPASWDHSPLPAGACVFRLHAAAGICATPGTIFLQSCASFLAAEPGAAHVAPVSFYETAECEQGVAPGCPTSDPWASEGLWWYELPHGADLDVVVCGPLCAQEFVGSACLRLPPAGQ